MRKFAIQKMYYFSVCIICPVITISEWLFSLIGKTYPAAESFFYTYFIIGILFIFADLWKKRSLKQDEKIWWSVLIVALGVVFLPAYWFKFNPGKEVLQSNINCTE